MSLDLLNANDVQIAEGGSLTGAVQNNSGAVLDLNGIVTGDIVNDGSVLLDGSVDGALSNDGTLTVDGSAAVTGILTNSGAMQVNDTLALGSLINSGSGPAWSPDMVVSDAILQVSGSGALTSGTLTNSSSIGLSDGARITSAVVNRGTIVAAGSVTGAGNLTHETGAIIDLGNGAGGDVFHIAGDAVLNGTFEMDIVLEGEELVGDLIDVAGAVSGNATFNFNLSEGEPADMLGNVTVLNYGAGQMDSVTVNGLPNAGAAVFAVVNNQDTSSYQIQSGANPAIGGWRPDWP